MASFSSAPGGGLSGPDPDGAGLLDALPVAAFTTDTAGRVVWCNTAAVALWGRRPARSEAGWTGAWRLFDAQGAELPPEGTPAACMFRGVPGPAGVVHAERPDGSRGAYLPRTSLLRDAGGRVTGVLELMLEHQTADMAPGSAGETADLTAARLAAIVAWSGDAIIGKGLDGMVTSWNAGAVRIFGWSAEEMLGQSITRIIPPELLSEETRIIACLRRGETVTPFDTERLTKDGRRIAISLAVSPIRDASGRVVGASKIARDITARKRAETLQRQLIEELNHRVKNTLATIQAIAGQSLRRAASPEAFVASFGGRVQALARVHDRLVAGEMAGVTVDTLVADALALDPGEEDRTSNAAAGPSRVVREGPAVLVEPRLAVQLALVLHELGRNARQHGALKVPDGRLFVDWRVEAGPGGLVLNLSWHEQAGPPLALFSGQGTPGGGSGAGTGFGIPLIERSLAANGGSAVRHTGQDGFTWAIRLPLPTPETDILAEEPAPPAVKDATAGVLAGRKILIVEDEPFVALEIEMELEEAGAIVVGPASSLEAAARMIESEALDAALLDANLAGRPVDSLAAALQERGVPFAFASGYGPSGLPEGFRDRPLLGKPFGPEALIQTVATLLETSAGATIVPLRKRD